MQGELRSMTPCNAKTRSGKPCQGKPMPNGRCRMHGGKGSGGPITHGRYSKISRPRISELILQFEQDANPIDLIPELSLLRALVQDYIERYDTITDALIAWHESFETKNSNPKPRQVLDIISVGKFIGEIGKLTERIQAYKQKQTISLETLNRVMEQFGVEVTMAAMETIDDEAQRSALLSSIEARWGSIRLDTVASGDS